MKKVLHIIENMNDGGAQKIFLDYLEHQYDAGEYDMRFMVLKNLSNNAYSKEIKARHFNVIQVGICNSKIKINLLRRIFNLLSSQVSIYKAIKKERPDIVHTHISSIFIFVLLPLWLLGVKHVFHTMHSDPYAIKGYKYFFSLVAFHIFNVTPIAVSSGQACRAQKRYYLRQLYILKNRIDINWIKSLKVNKHLLRERYNIKDDVFVLGSVGRIHDVKNYDFMIKVFDIYHRKNPNSCLIIIGAGDKENHIRNVIYKKKLTDCVVIYSDYNPKDVIQFYYMIDLFILTSISESCSLVTLEAQAAGVPCLLPPCIPNDVIYKNNVRKMDQLTDPYKWVEFIESRDICGKSYSTESENDIKTLMDDLSKIYNSAC